MKTLNMAQGSTEWSQARLGLVTASEFDALITPLWKPRTGEGVETYVHKKVCERVLNWSPDSGGSWAMEQGTLIEQIAVPWFGFSYDCEPKRVGLCVTDDGRCACSPDALIGDDSGLEVKAPLPPTHLKYLVKNEVPPEYRAQVHFSMYVTGRPHWTFLSFSRQLPPLVVNVERDEKIMAAIEEALSGFFAKYDPLLARINAMQQATQNTGSRAA